MLVVLRMRLSIDFTPLLAEPCEGFKELITGTLGYRFVQ